MQAYKIVTTKYEFTPEERSILVQAVDLCAEVMSNLSGVDNTDVEEDILSCAEVAAERLEIILDFFD